MESGCLSIRLGILVDQATASSPEFTDMGIGFGIAETKRSEAGLKVGAPVFGFAQIAVLEEVTVAT